MIDFTLTRENKLFLLKPNSRAAKDWCSEHLPDDAFKWGGAFAIDQHCIEAVSNGIAGDGLTIQ